MAALVHGAPCKKRLRFICTPCNIGGMTLDDWLHETHTKPKDFAALIGRDISTVSRLRRGETKPNWETLEAIERATGGNVCARDFFPNREAA